MLSDAPAVMISRRLRYWVINSTIPASPRLPTDIDINGTGKMTCDKPQNAPMLKVNPTTEHKNHCLGVTVLFGNMMRIRKIMAARAYELAIKLINRKLQFLPVKPSSTGAKGKMYMIVDNIGLINTARQFIKVT